MAAAAPSALERYTLILLAVLIIFLYGWGLARTFNGGSEAHAAVVTPPLAIVPVGFASSGMGPLPIVRVDYQLADTPAADQFNRRDVPTSNVYRSNIPRDLRNLNSVSERKRLFIKLMMPLVSRANEQVLEKRRRLLTIERRQTAGLAVSADDRLWLSALADEYGVESDSVGVLKRYVDIVPPSLALAQSAEESGWGTSRFAVEGNALFGQRVYRGDAGMVPKRRDPGKRHRVRKFDDLQDSVSRYLHNLNTHWAYDAFRDLRASMRLKNQPLDSSLLVGALEKYSERGSAYVKTIRSIISFNALTAFDRAEFVSEEQIPTPGA